MFTALLTHAKILTTLGLVGGGIALAPNAGRIFDSHTATLPASYVQAGQPVCSPGYAAPGRGFLPGRDGDHHQDQHRFDRQHDGGRDHRGGDQHRR